VNRLLDSLMETMFQLGSSAPEIAAAVESLSPSPPVPEKAFPDSFYLPKPVVVEESVPMRFYTEREARQLWKPYTPHVDVSGRCSCGHAYSEHLPCCVHLIEGCSCEEFHPVNAVAEGA